MSNDKTEQLLDEKGFCDLVNIKLSYARKLRIFGGGPQFLKIGRCVRYRRADIDSWLEDCRRERTHIL